MSCCVCNNFCISLHYWISSTQSYKPHTLHEISAHCSSDIGHECAHLSLCQWVQWGSPSAISSGGGVSGDCLATLPIGRGGFSGDGDTVSGRGKDATHEQNRLYIAILQDDKNA